MCEAKWITNFFLLFDWLNQKGSALPHTPIHPHPKKNQIFYFILYI